LKVPLADEAVGNDATHKPGTVDSQHLHSLCVHHPYSRIRQGLQLLDTTLQGMKQMESVSLPTLSAFEGVRRHL
jgi:N-acetylglutamate synthase-like GNAT family acetyltransferase